MRSFRIGRPSASMVVATIALFAAVGGLGYAAGSKKPSKPSTLQSGKTLKGVYRVEAFESGVSQGQFADTSITYQLPLKQAPTLNFLKETDLPTTACPGTFEKPKAKPGNLCVYEEDRTAVDSVDNLFAFGDGRDKLGFTVEVGSAASQGGLFQSNGSWAVTAP